jgi:hypothetical protein
METIKEMRELANEFAASKLRSVKRKTCFTCVERVIIIAKDEVSHSRFTGKFKRKSHVDIVFYLLLLLLLTLKRLININNNKPFKNNRELAREGSSRPLDLP